ncbi:MAG: hypothetical protein PHW02_06825 [bacterium]|nr:hypothetical protein [bacterium]
MKKATILFILAASFIMLLAKRDFSEELMYLAAKDSSLIEIFVERGSVLIQPTQNDSIFVYCVKSAKEGFSAESVKISVENPDSLLVKIKCGFPSEDGDYSGNLEVLIPEKMFLKSVLTTEGDINIQMDSVGVDTLRVKTIKGDISFSGGEKTNGEIIMTVEEQTVMKSDSCSSCSGCRQKEKRVLFKEGLSKIFLVVVEGNIEVK